jgi:hypothetical protein
MNMTPSAYEEIKKNEYTDLVGRSKGQRVLGRSYQWIGR